MKLLFFGCERHVAELLKGTLQRHRTPTPSIEVPAAGDLEAALLEHQPTHIVAASDDLVLIARDCVSRLGMTTKVQPLRVPPEGR